VYAGQWVYNDLGSTDPQQVALETGFDAYGIVSPGHTVVGDYDQGTPISLTVNANAAAGMLVATLNVGPLKYWTETTVSSALLFPIAHAYGPSITGSNGLTMVPGFMGLYADHVLTSTIGNLTLWHNPRFYLGFCPSGHTPKGSICAPGSMAFSDLRLVSVSVPEPSTLPLMSGALLALYAYHRGKGRRF
jgi:hypothetical protein